MSQQNVSKVRLLVVDDPALQKRLDAAKSEAEILEALVAIGSEKGLPFTAADLQAWQAGEGRSIELDAEQLGAVAGGVSRNTGMKATESYGTSYGNSIWCGFCGASSGSFMT